ncbi:MAG: hypothetical protein R2710_25955 [Acidimicrobiales bacterium]
MEAAATDTAGLVRYDLERVFATKRKPLRVNDQIVAWVDHDGYRHDIVTERPVSIWEIRNGYVKAVEAFTRFEWGVRATPKPQMFVFAVDDSQDELWHGWKIIQAAGLVRANDSERRTIGDRAGEPVPIASWEVPYNDRYALRVTEAQAPSW